MAEVTKYHVLVYGSPDGYLTNRSQISLYGTSGGTIAFVRFHDPGMPFPADSNTGSIITMHLPSSMFQSVLDVLRNEKPIQVYFSAGRAFFGTGSTELVGEGEA